MVADVLELLIELSKQRGKTTTSKLAKKLDSSQQTISRKIRYLEREGLIHRTSHHKGQIVNITDKGISFMRKRYLELRDILDRSESPGVSFGGNLVSGSGEGEYYISQDKYFMQFQDKLGFRPFLGTLNVKMKTIHDIKAKNDMEKIKPIVVKGFNKDKREFGDIRCYPCVVNRKVKGAVVIPDRTHHPSDIVEIIAPIYLRKELSIEDNDYVNVEMKP